LHTLKNDAVKYEAKGYENPKNISVQSVPQSKEPQQAKTEIRNEMQVFVR
jgi:hypothetical protein